MNLRDRPTAGLTLLLVALISIAVVEGFIGLGVSAGMR